ncbi:YceI family protein [Tunicatimonas pelagia]|uniref:YceI family protein n=1 Tax=Tunicatimonas pelagia TaxID=931531 RepID=UPI0026656133|nr:YceI family protein [Tunicatimonas pelagia]WKN44850.1 YceI family protein [Tunicatimonas pelagia]
MEMTEAVKTTWAIDPAHTEIQFKVRHMMLSTVTGSFAAFNGTLETERDDFANADIQFTAYVDSISTGEAQRDTHLKSDDFFAADRYPELRFHSMTFMPQSDNAYQMRGELTIRDQTRPITLAVIYHGTAVDPYGQTKAGFEMTGTISRKDFGLQWNAMTEAGGVVVGDEVRLVMNVQLIRQ